MIDPTLFDYEEIFGVVKATSGLKRNQTRPLRAEIIEKAISKYSGEQLKYIGDVENGKDFISSDGVFYESKSMDNLFQKNAPHTKEITLKNFYGTRMDGPLEKTFEYMILVDTKNYSIGVCDWDSCVKNMTIKDASIAFRVNRNDITFFATNIVPKDKGDLADKLTQFIEESL